MLCDLYRYMSEFVVHRTSQSNEMERVIERALANANAWIDVKQAEFKANKEANKDNPDSCTKYIPDNSLPFAGLRLSKDDLDLRYEIECNIFHSRTITETTITQLIDHLYLFVDFSQKDLVMSVLHDLVRAKGDLHSTTTTFLLVRLKVTFLELNTKRNCFCPETYGLNIMMEQLRENGRRYDTAPSYHDFDYKPYKLSDYAKIMRRWCGSLFKKKGALAR